MTLHWHIMINLDLEFEQERFKGIMKNEDLRVRVYSLIALRIPV